MRPGDTIIGTQDSALITGMQWQVQLRQGASTVVLTVLGRRLSGRRENGAWTLAGGPQAPSEAQIAQAMQQVEATAEAAIIAELSR